MLTFHRRPLTAVVADRKVSSRAMSFHTLGHIPAGVAEAEAVSDIVKVEAASVRCLDYLVADCIDWAVAVDFY